MVFNWYVNTFFRYQCATSEHLRFHLINQAHWNIFVRLMKRTFLDKNNTWLCFFLTLDDFLLALWPSPKAVRLMHEVKPTTYHPVRWALRQLYRQQPFDQGAL